MRYERFFLVLLMGTLCLNILYFLRFDFSGKQFDQFAINKTREEKTDAASFSFEIASIDYSASINIFDLPATAVPESETADQGDENTAFHLVGISGRARGRRAFFLDGKRGEIASFGRGDNTRIGKIIEIGRSHVRVEQKLDTQTIELLGVGENLYENNR